MERGFRFRQSVGGHHQLQLDLQDQNEAADVLHAACRSLMDDCGRDPRRTLEEVAGIHGLLINAVWPDDDLEEKQSLLCSLAFVAWRAARLLDLSREVHRWEAEYKRVFRQSLAFQVVDASFASEESSESAPEQAASNTLEGLFQALIYLHDQSETDPERVVRASESLYQLLEAKKREDLDLHHFFCGEAAKVAGGAMRSTGDPFEVAAWLDRAEAHFRVGVNPRPGLARVLFQRLAVCYMSGRFDVVTRICPRLDAEFVALGMAEDRVKCRILWAGSLKLEGRLQQALDVLEPVRQWKSWIRPALYGWVLLQSGDIEQILGNYDRALEEFGEAAHLFRQGRQYLGLADLGSMISCIYRAQGRLEESIQLFEKSRQDHARFGMKGPEAYHGILIAETYLAMGRPRDAEIEIRAALPILQEQGMLADAVIAVNLLREAVRQRKLDPSDTRDSLKPKK